MDVLVVSDDESLLENFDAEFTSAGLKLRVLRLLSSLAQTLRKEPPQAIVLDLDITEPPPWEVVRTLDLRGTTNILFSGANRYIYVYSGGTIYTSGTAGFNK